MTHTRLFLCIAGCRLHGRPSAGSGIAGRTHPRLVNQGLAGEHGFDLGREPVGPLSLSVPSTLRGQSQAAQTAWIRDAASTVTSWCRREVVRGEFALFNDAQYTVDLFSVSHLARRHLGADAIFGEGPHVGPTSVYWNL